MLETIREYGREQIGDAERDGALQRHGAFYERFAAEAEAGLRGADAARWLGRVEDELPNLRAAMARALEARRADRCAEIAAGLAAAMQRRYAEALQLLRGTLELCIRRADLRCGAEAVLGLAAAAAGLGDAEVAVRLDAIQRSLMDEAGPSTTPR